MQRTLGITGSEHHGQKIQKTFEETAGSELCFAVFPFVVENRNFRNGETFHFRQDRNVPVHLAINVHRLDHFAAIPFQSAVKVVKRDPGNGPHDIIKKL